MISNSSTNKLANATTTSLSEVLQMESFRETSPMSDGEKAMADSDLKFFKTSKQGKVGIKHVDLMAAEQKRR